MLVLSLEFDSSGSVRFPEYHMEPEPLIRPIDTTVSEFFLIIR
jgi:hypothetical protein